MHLQSYCDKEEQAKLDTIVGKPQRMKDANVPNLKYLQAIVKKNFCLHPIVP